VEGSFIDEGTRRSQCDRLYRVQLRSGGEAFVYFLIEHKSAPDGRVALQLLRYLARIWERHQRRGGKRGVPLRFSPIEDAPE
jgi:predicted transposase YdaD